MNEVIGSIVPQSTIRKKFKLLSADSNGNRKIIETGVEDIQELIESSYTNSLDYILDRFLEGDFYLDPGLPAEMTDDFLIDALDVSSQFVDNMEEARSVYGFPSDWSYEQIRVALNDKLKNIKSEVNVNGAQKNIASQESVQTEE